LKTNNANISILQIVVYGVLQILPIIKNDVLMFGHQKLKIKRTQFKGNGVNI